MALREATLPIRFAGGVETKEDEKHVPVVKLLKCENGVFIRNGTIGKRYGYEELPNERIDAPTTLPSARASGKRNKEFISFDDEAGYAFVPSASAWRKAGDLAAPKYTNEVVSKTAGDQINPDCAETSGVAAYAWQEAGGVFGSVVDMNTGRMLAPPQLLDVNGTNPRCTVVDDVLAIIWLDSPSNRLRISIVNPQDPAATITNDILFDGLDPTVEVYDVDGIEGDRTVIAFFNDQGELVIGYIAKSGVLGSPSTGLPGVLILPNTVEGALSVAYDRYDSDNENRISVMYRTNTTEIERVRVHRDFTSSTTSTVSTGHTDVRRLTQAWNTEADASSNRFVRIFFDESNASGRRWRSLSYDEADALGTEGGTFRDSKVASEAFSDSNHSYVVIVKESSLFQVYLLLREDGVVVGRMLPGIAGDAPVDDHLPQFQPDVTNRMYKWASTYKTRLDGINSDVFKERGIRLVCLDFSAMDTYQNCESGQTMYVGGAGMLIGYDGEGFFEQGFHYAPDDVAAPSQGSAGGSGIDVGTHVYRFTYGWTLANGEIEWSGVSIGTTVTVTGASDNEVTFNIPTYRHTQKTSPRAECIIGVWRSGAGVADTLHLVSSLDPAATGDNGYVANDPTVDTVSFVDEFTDAEALTKEPLYTNGGILSNDPVESGHIIACAKDRVFYNDPADPNVVRFTQTRREFYAVEATPFFQIRIDPFGGPVTALIEMDGAIVVFKRQAIYRFAGPGPNAAGGDGFSPVQLVNSDVGCVDQRLLAFNPRGIIFLSEKGWHLLGRDLKVEYIGADVERYTDPTRDKQTFVAATLIPDRHEVRCLTDSGITLMYSYFFDRWAEWTNHEGVTAQVVDDRYYYIRNLGQVWREDRTTHGDLNKQIKLKIRTANIKLTDYLQGFQRIHHLTIIGNYKSDHDLRVRAAYDYSPNLEDDILIDVAQWHNQAEYGGGNYGDGNYGGSPDVRYQMDVHIGEPCEAVVFEFEDVEMTGNTGASYELSEILITGGVKGRKYILPAERQA